MKEFKGIIEGNSEVRLISSMFSLYFHYSIYVFNTEGISGSPDRKLLKQSLAYAAQLVSAHKPFPMLQHRKGHKGICALVQFQERDHVVILLQDQTFPKLLVSSMHIL